MATDTAPVLSANRFTAAVLSGIVIVMLAMAFAAVPLYDAFCRVTGWGGTPQVAGQAPDAVLARTVTVRFDATVGRGLDWVFEPVELAQTLHIGETGLAYYRAENRSDRPVAGRASFNVSPARAGLFFSKIDCFCFTEQLLQPGESMLMPVTYFIDPDLAGDPGMDDIRTVTLSYTFFPAPAPAGDLQVDFHLMEERGGR